MLPHAFFFLHLNFNASFSSSTFLKWGSQNPTEEMKVLRPRKGGGSVLLFSAVALHAGEH